MVAEYLNRGKDNAITGRELCEALEISLRDLTNAVEKERRQGHPICANVGTPRGYYLAADPTEMAEYCRSLDRRVREIRRTRRACLRSMGL